VRVAFATCEAFRDGWDDDLPAARLLGAEFQRWDDLGVDWAAYDRVVVRSVWDYTSRPQEFLSWCNAVGPERLRNRPELVAFNADKRYLTELAAPTVPTKLIASTDGPVELEGEVVVKPNISAGGRDTGRFGPDSHAEAGALIERITAGGRVALVQPYLFGIDEQGETALVFFGGELSHVLHKRPVLREDGVAPVADHPLGVAAVMLDDDLVGPGTASAAQVELAHAIHDQISERFGAPVYARIDLVPGPDGDPLLLELEAVEPALYLSTAPGSAERFARAVRAS
jgi:hypothetical protein